MNFRKIYECNIKYAEKGTKGPFDALDTHIKHGKEQKPAIKGTPNFKLDSAGYGPLPPTGLGRKEYNVKYSKNGGLLESEYKELKKLGILKEDFEEEYIVDENEFDDVFDPYEEEDDDDLFAAKKEYEEWENGEDEFDPDDPDFESKINDIDNADTSDIMDFYNKEIFDTNTLGDDDFLTDDERNSKLGLMNRGEI
jgi:hypothetical protein